MTQEYTPRMEHTQVEDAYNVNFREVDVKARTRGGHKRNI